MPPAWNLSVLIQVVQHTHQRVICGKTGDRPFGKRPSQRVTHYLPVVLAMKIIDNHESAAADIFAQSRYFFGVEVPPARLLRKHPWIVEYLIVCKAKVPAVIRDVESRQPRKTAGEMKFCLRIVDRPPGPPRALTLVARVLEPCHVKFGFRLRDGLRHHLERYQ